MSIRAVVSLFLLLFFVLTGGLSAAFSGYFFDVANHAYLAGGLVAVAVACLFGAVASMISLLVAMVDG